MVRHERREHEDGSWSEALVDEETGAVEVTQYDSEGNVVGRTYGSTDESGGPSSLAEPEGKFARWP